MEDIIETQDIEYKENFGEGALRTLCAFANTKGGTLYIGVSDEGKVKGINLDNEILKNISDKIVSSLGVHPEIEVEKGRGKR